MLPAALATAEIVGANGRDLITAYVIGYEVETKIARGLNFTHYDKGWHPTATLGIFGAVAASAKLYGLKPEAIERALAIAYSLSSGVKANFGTMTKPLQVGRAAHSGLMATQLAEAEMTASTDAFEDSQGFAILFNGPDQYNLDPIVDNLGEPWDLHDPASNIHVVAARIQQLTPSWT